MGIIKAIALLEAGYILAVRKRTPKVYQAKDPYFSITRKLKQIAFQKLDEWCLGKPHYPSAYGTYVPGSGYNYGYNYSPYDAYAPSRYGFSRDEDEETEEEDDEELEEDDTLYPFEEQI